MTLGSGQTENYANTRICVFSVWPPGGALVSQAVLDDGIMEHLPSGGELQLEYGDVPLATLMWMDDMMKTTESLEKASEVNEKVNNLLQQRGLSLNETNSVCILIQSKNRNKMRHSI